MEGQLPSLLLQILAKTAMCMFVRQNVAFGRLMGMMIRSAGTCGPSRWREFREVIARTRTTEFPEKRKPSMDAKELRPPAVGTRTLPRFLGGIKDTQPRPSKGTLSLPDGRKYSTTATG